MQRTLNRLAQAILAKEPDAKISTSSPSKVAFPELGLVHHVLDFHVELPGKCRESWSILQSRSFGHNGYRAVKFYQL